MGLFLYLETAENISLKIIKDNTVNHIISKHKVEASKNNSMSLTMGVLKAVM